MKKNIEDIYELLINKIPEKHKSIIFFHNNGYFTLIEPNDSTYGNDLITLFGGPYYYLITKDTLSIDLGISYCKDIYTDAQLIKNFTAIITAFIQSLDKFEKAAFVMYRERGGMISTRMFSNKSCLEV